MAPRPIHAGPRFEDGPVILEPPASSVQPTAHATRAPIVQQLVLAHGKYVWRLLRYLGVADRDLDDVMQDVFATAYEKLGDIAEEAALRSWLYATCVFHAKNYRRRAHRHRETLVADLPESVSPAAQEYELELARAQELLLVLLERLDEEKRMVFVLHAIEELPMTDVAKAVGCRLSTAYFRFNRARAELRKGMSKK